MPEHSSSLLSQFDAMTTIQALAGDKPTTASMTHLGAMLASLIDRPQAFTAGYLYNVLAEPQRQAIGKPLEVALRAWWFAKNGGHPAHAVACEPMEIRCLPGNVEPGAYYLGKSERCGNAVCMAPFIPVIHNQRYCCSACKREARHNRRSTRRKHAEEAKEA